jgi:hypothetical protein
MIEASKKDSTMVNENCVKKVEVTQWIKSPVNRAVRSTPTVDNIMLGKTTGLTSLKLVSIPPENKIIAKDIIPMKWAVSWLPK